MAQFNKEIVMTLTTEDRIRLNFAMEVFTDIKDRMMKENADLIENTYTGEIIEFEDINQALWTMQGLMDKQESWGWKLV